MIITSTYFGFIKDDSNLVFVLSSWISLTVGNEAKRLSKNVVPNICLVESLSLKSLLVM